MTKVPLSDAIILIGIACIVAAIVGSFRISRMKARPISLRRQILLAAFGFVLIGIGLVDKMRPGIEGIEITSPAPDQRVAAREFVSGRAPPGTQIWLIVHPRETDGCWAQGPGTADAEGTWQIMGAFGEPVGRHAGKPYEVRAIAGPRSSSDGQLEVGLVRCALDAQLSSAWINVVRM